MAEASLCCSLQWDREFLSIPGKHSPTLHNLQDSWGLFEYLECMKIFGKKQQRMQAPFLFLFYCFGCSQKFYASCQPPLRNWVLFPPLLSTGAAHLQHYVHFWAHQCKGDVRIPESSGGSQRELRDWSISHIGEKAQGRSTLCVEIPDVREWRIQSYF